MLEGREHKLFIKSRFARRGIYWLPNLFTLAALFAGFYGIVQAMGGEVRAEPGRARGGLFRIEVPLAAATS